MAREEVRAGKDVPGTDETALFPVPKDLVFQCLTEASKATEVALTKLTHTDGKQAGLGEQLGWVGGLGKTGLVAFCGGEINCSRQCVLHVYNLYQQRRLRNRKRNRCRELLEVDQVFIKEDSKGSS